jgi:pimeloyl-ACP methyl ester carboxylesterase
VAAAGQSWGANVVLELADRYPSRVRGVACVDGGIRDVRDRLPDWDDAARRLAPPELRGTEAAEIETRVRQLHADWPAQGIEGALANFEFLPNGTVAPWLTRDRHMLILRQLWKHRPSEVRSRLAVPIVDIEARAHAAHHDIHAQKPDLVAKLLLDALV